MQKVRRRRSALALPERACILGAFLVLWFVACALIIARVNQVEEDPEPEIPTFRIIYEEHIYNH